MPKRAIAKLQVHPFNREIYGTPDAGGLKESLEQFGLEYPIEVDPKNRILSGARRWKAAKELGWKQIEVRDVRIKNEEEARKHILLANAYRSVKTIFVRQKEADAYRGLLARGEMTKEDLAALARQGGKAPTTADELLPQRLAAAAAGLTRSTYQQATYITDPRRGEREIEVAARQGLIASKQATILKQELRASRGEFKRDQISADAAASVARKRLTEAQLDHGYTPKERLQKAANEAALDAIRKGRTFVSAIDTLRHQQHAKNLGPRVAFILAGTVYEAKQSLERLAQKSGLALPTKPQELERLGKIEDVEFELVK